jgi:hypothetical protein
MIRDSLALRTNAPAGEPRMNRDELVMITVLGQACSPLSPENPYRIGQDGVSRILPGTGGIVLSHRVGDACVGLQADHVEPGVSIRHEQRVRGGDGANLALQTYSCVGNWAVVTSGRCAGARGVVTGKHGGVDTVLVDFPFEVLRNLALGDRVQVYAYGLGLRLLDHPAVTVMNASPRLIAAWGLTHGRGPLVAPVTHVVPAKIMGSGLGRNSALRGDYDIQLFDQEVARRYGLNSLRFGDLVAIENADSRYGRSFSQGHVTIGVVIHSESTVAGHGPGVVSLLTGARRDLRYVRDGQANIAGVLQVRAVAPPKSRRPIVTSRSGRVAAAPRAALQRSRP